MVARPIFVLGLQRSGTTWIGNLLEAHPEVAAVVDHRHRGIHESLFFSHFARAWDWSRPEQRAAALEAFLASDYGALLELDRDESRAVRGAGGAADTFAAAMETFAWRQGAAAWVEKSPHHTRHAEEIAGALQQAMFVAIHRRTASLIGSRLSAYGRRSPRGLRRALAILRAAASNAYHRRLVDRLARRHPGRVIRIDFEQFQAGGEGAVSALVAALGLAAAPGLAPRFGRNSSFASDADRASALSPRDLMLAAAADAAVAALPGPLLRLCRALMAGRRVVFPHWVWREPSQRPPDVAVATPRTRAAGAFNAGLIRARSPQP